MRTKTTTTTPTPTTTTDRTTMTTTDAPLDERRPQLDAMLEADTYERTDLDQPTTKFLADRNRQHPPQKLACPASPGSDMEYVQTDHITMPTVESARAGGRPRFPREEYFDENIIIRHEEEKPEQRRAARRKERLRDDQDHPPMDDRRRRRNVRRSTHETDGCADERRAAPTVDGNRRRRRRHTNVQLNKPPTLPRREHLGADGSRWTPPRSRAAFCRCPKKTQNSRQTCTRTPKPLHTTPRRTAYRRTIARSPPTHADARAASNDAAPNPGVQTHANEKTRSCQRTTRDLDRRGQPTTATTHRRPTHTVTTATTAREQRRRQARQADTTTYNHTATTPRQDTHTRTAIHRANMPSRIATHRTSAPRQRRRARRQSGTLPLPHLHTAAPSRVRQHHILHTRRRAHAHTRTTTHNLYSLDMEHTEKTQCRPRRGARRDGPDELLGRGRTTGGYSPRRLASNDTSNAHRTPPTHVEQTHRRPRSGPRSTPTLGPTYIQDPLCHQKRHSNAQSQHRTPLRRHHVPPTHDDARTILAEPHARRAGRRMARSGAQPQGQSQHPDLAGGRELRAQPRPRPRPRRRCSPSHQRRRRHPQPARRHTSTDGHDNTDGTDERTSATAQASQACM